MSVIHINHLILKKLEEKDRKIAWLAKQVGYCRNNLRKILKNNREIYPELILSISEVLEEDCFAYYSQELKERNNAKGRIKNRTNYNNDITQGVE